MKTFTVEDIRSWKPCYDPAKYLAETWTGTAIDILKDDRIPAADRLWVVLRIELISERVMRIFAVWSYRQTLGFIKDPDPRSIAAADTAERFANGEATKEELVAAESAAWSAARSAARSAAWSAAWSAAAARSAAWSAARSAAWSAAESAESAAAGAAAWSAQVAKLIEMIETLEVKS